MELDLNVLRPQERASLQLRLLYEQEGFRKYHMGRFEEYGLYQENRRFLSSEQVITFTDLDGRLLALKPDVTLSIAKNAQPAPGECKRYYYTEQVCRPSRESHTFAEISQMGLECIGAVDAARQAEVVRLAVDSLNTLGTRTFLEVSHMGYLTGLLDALAVDAAARPRLLELLRDKNAHELRQAALAAGLDEEAAGALCALLSLHGPFETALAEARTASLLQHPNIVTVIDFTYDSAYAYLVMEYVDGMSLEEFLATVDGNSLTYDECACIADALAQALSYAHENGVLHLDIKPANVLIDRSGHVKLADFGMATLTSAAGFGGARGGPIGYMPPEQLRGDAVDERSDVFALAAVLYESLCATAPFRAGPPADSLKRIDKGVIVPSSLLPDIPENSEEALLYALSPEPSERMASIADFSDWFLPHLGDAREGRKSLARMIEKLTADDEGDSGETEATGQRRVWELDPAEGYLGSRAPRPRA